MFIASQVVPGEKEKWAQMGGNERGKESKWMGSALVQILRIGSAEVEDCFAEVVQREREISILRVRAIASSPFLSRTRAYWMDKWVFARSYFRP